MRNLELLDSVHVGDAVELEGTQCISVDYDTKDVYCASKKAIYILNGDNQQVTLGVSIEDYVTSDGADLVGIQHLPDQMSVCVAVTSGDILLWNVTTMQIECVGTADSGILAMGWSPDHELMVLITGGNSLLMMTRDFDPLTEVPLQQSGFGEAEFVNVGWGKKETQFHGQVGKQAAVEKSAPVNPVFAWDDKLPRISWRGDGQYFVVSSINVETGARILRTWTREGALHATSESVDGVEQALAWRPTGSVIATSQRKPNRHDIVFFERNGLRHGEFPLNFGVSEVKVREVMWNIESSVLLVWCEEKEPEGGASTEQWTPKSWIQLWTSGNYHWYLKQSLEFSTNPQDRVCSVEWDPEREYVLHVICSGGHYIRYQWAWTTHSSGTESALVAVINGEKLLMTGFRDTVVPPPMCAYSIKLPSPALSLFYMNAGDFMVHCQDGKLLYYKFEDGDKTDGTVQLEGCGGTGFAKKCQTPVLKSGLSFHIDTFGIAYPLQHYHFLSLSPDTFLMCTLTPMGNTSVIHLCTIKEDNSIVSEISIDVDGRVIALTQSEDKSCVAVQLNEGSLLRLLADPDNLNIIPWQSGSGEVVRFPQPCPHMSVCTLGGEQVVIGLTERFRLFVNNIQLATNCTSYAIHEEFLLLTTHAHTCRCICRTTKLSALATLSDGKAHPYDESVRRVERGSRIVCVVPNDTKLVLQMPRGNLEVIHPRALVLARVRHLLEKLEFGAAFGVMRKHRINMNLLYDHDPQSFLQNVQTFISQIDNSTHLNLFISELQEEDVTATMYTATYKREVSKDPVTSTTKSSKIDKICDAMKQALTQADSDKYLFSILTAQVKKTKPELDQALSCIKNLRESGNNQGKSRSEEALKYLLFLVDVNELYDVALGTYDFDLVLMVAEKSQKDPKEYLPFLNNLRRLEPNYQTFSIDKHLKRHRVALKSIVLCGQEHFEECVAFIKEQRLYPEALELYSHSSEEYKVIASAYGDYLSEKKYHEEAGLLYLKASHYEQALEQFEKADQWRQCMCVAAKLGYGTEKMSELSRRLAGVLKEKKMYKEAAVLMEQYAEDAEEAIVTLIQGQQWEEALRTMCKYNREDFIETDLKPGLLEAVEQYTELLSEQRHRYEKHRTRLAVVREEKERQRLEIMEGGGEYSRADADLFSDTSSATGDSVISDGGRSKSAQSRKSGSIYTKVSGSSRKAKRKNEKKKRSLKEGSMNEDLAIVEAMAQIIKHVDGLRDETGSLLKTLVEFHYEKQARQLQLDYQAFLKLIQDTVASVWDPIQEDVANRLPSSFGPDSTANTIAMAMQQGQRPGTATEEQLEPVFRCPPVLSKDNTWKLNILSRTTDGT